MITQTNQHWLSYIDWLIRIALSLQFYAKLNQCAEEQIFTWCCYVTISCVVFLYSILPCCVTMSRLGLLFCLVPQHIWLTSVVSKWDSQIIIQALIERINGNQTNRLENQQGISVALLLNSLRPSFSLCKISRSEVRSPLYRGQLIHLPLLLFLHMLLPPPPVPHMVQSLLLGL